MVQGRVPAPYRVQAYNTARDSENKIHDDDVARSFGFAGGLVPGVDVYAYMTHPPLALWGRAYLEHGWAECRFLKPVYDGDEVLVIAEASDAGLSLRVESRGELCATGRAVVPEPAPVLGEIVGFHHAPPRESRLAASEASLAPGDWLGIRPLKLSAEFLARYAAAARETNGLYAAESLAHPGLLLRTCNWALSQNVVLGPWIHTGSTVQHLGLAHAGNELNVRARVARNYEHKGHRFVELDALVLADERRPLARITHTAIYRPRQAVQTP